MSASLRTLYSDSPQVYADNLRGYLDTNGIPPTAENLNRISLAVSQAMRGEETAPNFEAAIERTMRPRGAARTATLQRNTNPGSTPEQDVEAQNAVNAERAAMEQEVGERGNARTAVNAHTADANTGPVRQQIEGRSENTRGAQVAEANRRAGGPSGDANGIGIPNDTTRPGTIPRARFIDENDPTAGMFDARAVGGRQADETDVDQTGLGMALLAPLGAAGFMPAQGMRNLGVTLMQRRLAAPGANGGNPPAAGAAISAQPVPAIPGSGGAAARLPAPQAVIASPPPTVQNFSPATVTVTGRGGASAVRDPYSMASQPAGRTALTTRMMSRAERNAGRRISETAGPSRRDGAQR